jgi:hypothetical protein
MELAGADVTQATTDNRGSKLAVRLQLARVLYLEACINGGLTEKGELFVLGISFVVGPFSDLHERRISILGFVYSVHMYSTRVAS